MSMINLFCLMAAMMALTVAFGRAAQADDAGTPRVDNHRQANRVRPYEKNPRYWQYKGRPVVLLGGSRKDNLFQIPNLKEHLDLLHSVGGNVIRNTMSDRPAEGYEIKAFKQLDDGKYDLNQWNDAYWERFETMLKLTAARDIIVQIEVWDRFDHARDMWQSDPFNPKNNINYTHQQSQLAAEYPDHPGANKQPFFYTVPELNNNTVVLPYQQKFVDKMLSYSLQYDNVLYCMDNETKGSPKWAEYWAKYIRAQAAAAGVRVELTEMWDAWDVREKMHWVTYDQPELYSFVDISQNSQTPGQKNWDNAQWVWQRLATEPRPINSTKIYGASTGSWLDRGITEAHAVNTFWRNVIGGFASSRFHRPPSGIALTDRAQTQLRSARLLLKELDIFNCKPDAGLTLLTNRAENEAYLTRVDGRQYAVYFTDGGQVGLDLRGVNGTFRGKWLDIERSIWLGDFVAKGGEVIPLQPPKPQQWIALLTISAD